MSEEIFVVGEVNEQGETALTEWLRDNLREPDHAEAWATNIIANLDGSFAYVQGLTIELRGNKSNTGNPVTYSFGAGEYDLVTYNEDGEVIARRTA